MTANELNERYPMMPHIEHGAFMVCNYEHQGPGRASSGAIYYFVPAGEWTEFHQIDCDEYWCYVEGAPLEMWLFDQTGKLTLRRLGVEEGCEPIVHLPAGVVFGSRSSKENKDGTFLTCITVPRYSDDGFRLLLREEMEATYPETKDFYPKD